MRVCTKLTSESRLGGYTTFCSLARYNPPVARIIRRLTVLSWSAVRYFTAWQAPPRLSDNLSGSAPGYPGTIVRLEAPAEGAAGSDAWPWHLSTGQSGRGPSALDGSGQRAGGFGEIFRQKFALSADSRPRSASNAVFWTRAS